MVSAKILHYLVIFILLPLAVHGMEGIICEADLCHRVDCAPEPICTHGFKSVHNAGECGCCSACVQMLGEGSECSTGNFRYPTNQSDPDGSYAWHGYPPVCRDGLYCEDNVCKRDCSSNAEQGDCEAAMRHWYYSTENGECLRFLYGGCGGNFNNYATKQLCTQTCIPGIRCEANLCPRALCPPEPICTQGFKSVLNAGGCGCCSACVQTLDEESECDIMPYKPVFDIDGSYTWHDYNPVCKDGLFCTKHSIYNVCKLDNCDNRRQEALGLAFPPERYVPQCNLDGSFRAKQCDPGQECYCVNEQNVRIGQYSVPMWNANDMTCDCAREQELGVLQGVEMECTDLGNFDISYSVRVLPHAMMTSLMFMLSYLCLLTA